MGVINTNTTELALARQKKAEAQKRLVQERQAKLSYQATQQEVEVLKREMTDVKSLLSEILNIVRGNTSANS